MNPRKVKVKEVASLEFAFSLTLGELRDMVDSLTDWPNSSTVNIEKVPVTEGSENTAITVVRE